MGIPNEIPGFQSISTKEIIIADSQQRQRGKGSPYQEEINITDMGIRNEILEIQSPSNEENIIADTQHQRGKAPPYEEISITILGIRNEVFGIQSPSNEENIIADSQHQREEESYQDHGIKYNNKAEASVDPVVKAEQSLVSIHGHFKDSKFMLEQSYGLGVQLGLIPMNTLSVKQPEKKEAEIKEFCRYLWKLYKKIIAEFYPNVNKEVFVAQFLQHIDSEELADLKTFLQSVIGHRLSSSYFHTDSRSDDGDYPSDGQCTQSIVGPLQKEKKPGSQYSIALLPMEEVDAEEKQQLEDISSYTPLKPIDERTERDKDDDTASKLVDDEIPIVHLKLNDQIKEDVEHQKRCTTAELVVDDDRSEKDIDCNTTAKWVEDSSYPFAHSDSEESEDLLSLRSTTETSPDNSLENVTLDQAPCSNLDEGIRQCFFEWLRGQDGVTSYYYMRSQITIHVQVGAIATISAIENIINTKFRQLRHPCIILFTDPGVSVPCANPDDTSPSESGASVPTPSNKEIRPGKEIACSFVATAGHVRRSATFSGKICGNGMTAGHIVPSEMTQTICIKFELQVIGIPILVIKNVNVPIRGTGETRTTLGDLLFFLLNDQDSVNNSVECDPFNRGSKETYNVVLHRGPIKEDDSVMVILRDESVKFGRIARIDHNDITVSNTLYIVDENNLALTTDGDSGAIVVLRPKGADRTLRAIGVVTHLHCKLKPEFQGTNYTELNAENSTSLGTIAIRLYDVLVAVQQGAILGDPLEFRKIDLGHAPECIEFSGPLATGHQFDSGIQSRRSLEDPETSGI